MSNNLLGCMKSFVVVAKYNGFSPAARQLNLSTPAITKQIQYLEESIGKLLLKRTTRFVTLTEAGHIYLSYALKILDEVNQARNAIHNLENEPHGKLVIGIPGIFSSMLLMKILQEFLLKYPKISLHTTEENSLDDLLNGKINLAISEFNIPDQQFNKELLCSIKRGIYASPKYIKNHGKPKSLTDLKNHNCLIYKRVSPNDEWLLSTNKKIKVTGNYSTNSAMNIIYAALAGTGLIWCPDLVVDDEVKSGELVPIKLKEKAGEINVYLYYKPVYYDNTIKLIADYLKQTMEKLMSFPEKTDKDCTQSK